MRTLLCLMLISSALFASTASAQDEQVLKRLTKHGDLGRAQATRLISKVTTQMKRSADMTQSPNDPLRMAVSRAVLGRPVPGDAMSAAKVRLRLYAGLNSWALDNLFSPAPGAVASCMQAVSGSQQECEALIAASGKISVAQARKAGGGPAPMVAGGGFGGQPQARPGWGGQQQPRFGRQPQQRFGGYNNSGYRPRPQQQARPAWGQQQQRFGTPPRAGQQPAGYGAQPRPAPVARPQAPPRVVQTNTKEEYKRRRQAYLERQKARLEERKAKLRAANTDAQPIERGPASADEAALIGAEAPKKGAPAEEESAKQPSAKSSEAAEAAPPPKKKEQLDGDFLDGLMDDPLGSKK